MIRCALCGRPVGRRWWERGILSPLPVCVKRAASTCRALLDARAGL